MTRARPPRPARRRARAAGAARGPPRARLRRPTPPRKRGEVAVASPEQPTELFGHPRGLAFLFATEMWERFSYYGMRALLVLYMVKYLLLPEHADTVIGLATLRGAFESAFGQLGAQPLASHIYGLYTGLVYLTPLIGGIVADRW